MKYELFILERYEALLKFFLVKKSSGSSLENDFDLIKNTRPEDWR